VSILLLGIAISASLCERMTVDPNVRSNPELLTSVQKGIKAAAQSHPGRYCQSVVLKSLETPSKIAPGCDFVLITWRKSLGYPFAADPRPKFFFELLAVRRSNHEVMRIPAVDGSAEWVPKFLVWAKCHLKNSDDASEIETAIEKILRTTVRFYVLPKIRSDGAGRWIVSVEEQLAANTEFEVTTDSNGVVDQYKMLSGGNAK
jgi:hypothetical protein